jgi:hypothetical protein
MRASRQKEKEPLPAAKTAVVKKSLLFNEEEVSDA